MTSNDKPTKLATYRQQQEAARWTGAIPIDSILSVGKAPQSKKRQRYEPPKGSVSAEDDFLALLKSYNRKAFRHGWPDFMVEMDDKVIMIEVKRGQDKVSQRQRSTFDMLERVGLEIYVWNPECPQVVVPWRQYTTFDQHITELRATVKQQLEIINNLLHGNKARQ